MMKISTKSLRYGGLGITSAAGLLLASCASTSPPPVQQLTSAQAAIAQAVAAESSQYAPVELRTAQDKLTRAEAAVQEEDYLIAQHLAQQAEADALLASAKSRVAKTRQGADRTPANPVTQ